MSLHQIKKMMIPLVSVSLLWGCSSSESKSNHRDVSEPKNQIQKLAASSLSSASFERKSDMEFSRKYPYEQLSDRGYQKWELTFTKISGEPPFNFRIKRNEQIFGKAFLPPLEVFTAAEILEAKFMNAPLSTIIGEQGFLPGEKVTFRLASKDETVFEEITCYPRPLELKKMTGETFLQAELISIVPTSYNITVSNIGENEEFQFISTSGNETINYPLKGSFQMNYMPGVIGLDGGVSQIEIRFKNGQSHKINLPWGKDLLEYLKGKK